MSSFSGISALLTVSLIAVVTIQMLKDKFESVEFYGEVDELGNPLNQNENFYTTSLNNGARMQQRAVGINNNAVLRGDKPMKGQNNMGEPFTSGDFFTAPYTSPNANQYSGQSDAFSVYQTNVQASTPTAENFAAIGSGTLALPGPNGMMQPVNGDNERAGSLSLCAQNMNTFAGGITGGLAESLLPQSSNMKVEGFNDVGCDFKESLANQVFLSPTGVIGANPTQNSLRNGNLQLRSEPPNPMLNVGPWMNSTIYPDLLRKPLEGCGPSFGLYGTGNNSSGIPVSIAP
tara:strand:- start:232 stop:1098 length:867 start_codon:yes stop_codon:yes gene_type:complete